MSYPDKRLLNNIHFCPFYLSGCDSMLWLQVNFTTSTLPSSKESWAPKNWCFWTVVLDKTLESPLYCKEIQPVHPKGGQSWVFFGRNDVKRWNSSTLATWCEELTSWKRLWCWEGLGAGEEGDDRGWDGWMASLTRWTWVWVNSGSWWWTGRPGVLRFMGSQRVGHDWASELNWTDTRFNRENEARKVSVLPCS